MNLKWDRRFLKLTAEIATWSKDPSSQVGAVIVHPDRTIVATGYNGLPRGVHDDPEILTNRERKLIHIIHAEENAMLRAGRDAHGCALYTYPYPPCGHCSSLIIQAGITRVAFPDFEHPPRWAQLLLDAADRLRVAGIAYDAIQMED